MAAVSHSSRPSLPKRRFFASEAHKTGRPQPGDVAVEPKVRIDTETTVDSPLNLAKVLHIVPAGG